MDLLQKARDNCSPYAYRALHTSSTIRILRLKPGMYNEPLRGTLVQVDLSDAPEDYIALSYVWGVPEYERPLLSPQGTLYVTRNLEEALKRLRIPQNSISVWADAVYINQEDIRERGHQVALMGRIYTSAAKVIIWLGLDTTGSARAWFTILRDHQSLSNTRTTDHVAPLLELSRCDYFKRIGSYKRLC
jgi:hypothetical protein